MDFLVVDPNIAFATLLEQELVRLGHRAVKCTSGDEALTLARQTMPEVALLDMALEGPDALVLGQQLRELDAGVRLMLIPMAGDDPVLGDDAPSIQGILTKPFFIPELPNAIQAARNAPFLGTGLTAPVYVAPPPETSSGVAVAAGETGVAESELDQVLAEGEAGEVWDPGSLDWLAGLDDDASSAAAVSASARAPAEPTAAAEAAVVEAGTEPAQAGAAHVEPGDGPDRDAGVSRRTFRMNQGRIETVMRELVADIGANGVLLTSDQGLLTSVGNLDEAEIELISAAVLRGVQTSAEVARILGREQLRFEQSIAGGSYMLYALSVHDAVLAVTVSGDARLGLLRLAARVAAAQIATLCVPR